MPDFDDAELKSAVQAWLVGFLDAADAVAGTVHLHVGGGLRLRASVNIPLPV